MHTIAGLPNFANAVVNDQPAVPGEDRWSAATDFEAFPGRYRSRQPLAEYEPGSWGPHEAVRLADDVGGWHDPEGSEADKVAAPRAA
jgi:hypothetical protein